MQWNGGQRIGAAERGAGGVLVVDVDLQEVVGRADAAGDAREPVGHGAAPVVVTVNSDLHAPGTQPSHHRSDHLPHPVQHGTPDAVPAHHRPGHLAPRRPKQHRQRRR